MLLEHRGRDAAAREASRLAALGLLVLLALLPWVFGLRAEGFAAFLKPSTWRFLGLGLALTLAVSAIALMGSLPLALGLALARHLGPAWLRRPAALWVEGIRALPLVGLVFLLFLRLGRLGRAWDLEVLGAPTLALTAALLLYTSAVNAEALRAALLALPAGQWEAARALGLRPLLQWRQVILPQALRLALPNLVAQMATLVKDSSLGGIIGVLELYRRGVILFQRDRNPLETLYVVALLYLLVNALLAAGAERLGARVAAPERPG